MGGVVVGGKSAHADRLMITYFIASGFIFALMATLVGVEGAYRRFAANHPEYGPYREKPIGCGTCEKRSDCEEASAVHPKGADHGMAH